MHRAIRKLKLVGVESNSVPGTKIKIQKKMTQANNPMKSEIRDTILDFAEFAVKNAVLVNEDTWKYKDKNISGISLFGEFMKNKIIK